MLIYIVVGHLTVFYAAVDYCIKLHCACLVLLFAIYDDICEWIYVWKFNLFPMNPRKIAVTLVAANWDPNKTNK